MPSSPPIILCLLSLLGLLPFSAQAAQRPNIILIMADDLGYGDTGFNGNTLIQTPHMDRLAAEGVTLTHFYSGNSVCSPTRATCLTGRHHDRMGIWGANAGHLPQQEITLAQILKENGYATGHFGKWHLGTLNPTMSSKGANRRPAINFAPPWKRGYDHSFVTESAVRLWDPGLGNRAKNNPFFENSVALDGNSPSLKGGAARVVTDRIVPFIESSLDDSKPFFAVCWYHAPHEDVAAGPKYLAMYPGHGEAAHYYGCITEMDEQIGRIVATLKQRNVFNNTLILFCSDNGPEGKKPQGRRMGSSGGFRGRKRDLYDGGVRVPAFAVWPGVIPAGSQSDAVLSTLDYFPTIQHLIEHTMPDDRPIDGENILDILVGERSHRQKSILFRYNSRKTSSIVRGSFKLVLPTEELFDLEVDPKEANDLSSTRPDLVQSLKDEAIQTFANIQASQSGADYNDPSFQSIDPWRPLKLNSGKQSK